MIKRETKKWAKKKRSRIKKHALKLRSKASRRRNSKKEMRRTEKT